MNKLLPFSLLALVAPVLADVPQHMIDDPQGDWGTREPTTGEVFIVVPEVDVLWVDAFPKDDVLEISIHVDDLDHKTFEPTFEALNFLFSWSHLRNGSYVDGEYVVADHYAFLAFPEVASHRERIEFVTSTSRTAVEGGFDWQNNTVMFEVPLTFFKSGDTLAYGIVWSSAELQREAGVKNGRVEFGDRAPNDGWGAGEIQIP